MPPPILNRVKPGTHTLATIADLKIKNIIEFVSVELSVKHDTKCP